MPRPLVPVALSLAALASTGCGGPDPIAFQNRVFYQYDEVSGGDTSAFEQRYPPLDLQAQAPNPEYVGYSVLGASIHISRPRNWAIRSASNKPESRYIEYVSPNEYLFAIYERVDSPQDLWRDIMNRYEDDAKNAGAELLGARIPVATWNAQGREYVVRRRVKAAKEPFETMSHEFLARSDHRIVLVQIVYQGDPALPALSDELLRVVKTLEIN